MIQFQPNQYQWSIRKDMTCWSQWHKYTTHRGLVRISGSYVICFAYCCRCVAVQQQTYLRRCGILRARRTRRRGISQESDLRWAESASSDINMVFICVTGICQFKGSNSSVAQCVAHDSTINGAGCPIACVAQRAIVPMWYFIDPCWSLCLQPYTKLDCKNYSD